VNAQPTATGDPCECPACTKPVKRSLALFPSDAAAWLAAARVAANGGPVDLAVVVLPSGSAVLMLTGDHNTADDLAARGALSLFPAYTGRML